MKIINNNWEGEIKNYTPHEVNIQAADVLIKIPSEGVARLATIVERVPGTLFSRTRFGKPENLPEPQKGVYYIVSHLLKSVLSGRADLVVPSELIRDDKGQVVACQSLGL